MTAETPARLTPKMAAAGLLAALSACVAPLPHPLGHDFSRAAFSTFVLQTTTLPDVEAAIGAPLRISTISGLANQRAVTLPPGTPIALTLVNYFYAPFGPARPLSQTPAKSATMVFFQGRLVGYDVNSTIPGDDNAPIPEDRLAGLQRGATTRNDAIALLGPPDGQSVVFAQPAGRRNSIMTYNWSLTEGDMTRRKMLRVEFDGAGRFSGYTMLDNSFPAGSAPIPFPAPQSVPRPPPIAEPVRPYADPGHT
jgi:hypothetical protein